MEHETTSTDGQLPSSDDGRREFLKKCGRFGLTAPPTLMLLLSTAKRDYAVAGSFGGKPGYGYGDKNHDHSGPPGLNK
jgi:hypothetical protein